RLIIAPDGVLALIPFETLLLRDPPASGVLPRDSYVVERYAVSYTPSASVLATRAARSGGPDIVAVGDPAFGADTTLAPLPTTAAEIEALRAIAGDRPIAVLEGAAASRSRVLALDRLARADVIHLATHGEVNESEPEHSGLWLAPDSSAATASRL